MIILSSKTILPYFHPDILLYFIFVIKNICFYLKAARKNRFDKMSRKIWRVAYQILKSITKQNKF